MENGLKMVIGMSLAYVTSFAGLILAYYSYKKHKKEKDNRRDAETQNK